MTVAGNTQGSKGRFYVQAGTRAARKIQAQTGKMPERDSSLLTEKALQKKQEIDAWNARKDKK